MADEVLEREFPTVVVVSAMTGILLADPDDARNAFGAVHECLEWMAGGPVWTHQLPRVSEEAEAAMRKRGHGELIDQIKALEGQDASEANRLGLEIVAKLAPTMTVPRLKPDEHQRIAPLAELEAMIAGRPDGTTVQ